MLGTRKTGGLLPESPAKEGIQAMYQTLPAVAGTAVLGETFAAPQAAQKALAFTGIGLGVYLLAAAIFLLIGFVLRHVGTRSRSTV